MSKSKFVHLHLHTDFSLLDSPMTVIEAVNRAAEMEFSSLALTDHGSMCGAIRFQQDSGKAGIKPIFGNEVYVTNTDLDAEESMSADVRRGNYSHLVLLAENNEGLASITNLTSLGAIKGFYYRPRVDYQMLAENSKGVICLTACLSGIVASAIMDKKYALAFKRLRGLKLIYGENLYYEIQFNEMPIQAKVNYVGIRMAKQLGIPLVYTTDVHYSKPEDNEYQDVMVLMRRGKTASEWKAETFDVRSLYMKDAKAVCRDYLEWGKGIEEDEFRESVQSTAEIASRCNASFNFDDYQYPGYDTDEENLDRYFLRRVKEGFSQLEINGKNKREYVVRLQEELKLIMKKKLPSYLMIIADLMKFAKDNNIPVGPGRGSVSGSLTAYALGITKIDPLRFNLSFHRFLSEEREELPDIDLDFCDWGRELVIGYLAEKYGDDKVLPIIAFSTLQARGLIRDIGKVLEVPARDLGAISRELGKVQLKKGIIMPTIMEMDQFQKHVEKYPDLFRYAAALEGRNRHMSRHAAGVVVTPMNAASFVPIVRSGDILHCGFDYEPVYLSLDQLKVLKIDVLGVSTLSVIGDTIELVEQRGEEFDEEYCWRLDDPDVYKEMRQGNTAGTFQMESYGYQRLLRDVSPSTFEHLIAAVALYRPSTLAANIHNEYIKNKKRNFRHKNPVVGRILDISYGCLIFQEQVMELAAELGNLSLGEADLIRRALTKWQSTKVADWKGRQVIEDFREKFIEGAAENGMKKDEAEHLYSQMEKFSLYAFNRSHSCAYALIAYQTMYLKTFHPLEYMTCLLRRTSPGAEYRGSMKIERYIKEAERLKLTILPPDIEKSGVNFDIGRDNNTIVTGLSIIKWVGATPAQAIMAARPFDDFGDFLEKVGNINSRATRAMIAARCFDDEKFGTESEMFEKLKALKNIEADQNDIAYEDVMYGMTF